MSAALDSSVSAEESLLVDQRPLQLEQAQRPENGSPELPAAESAPVVMWIDDDVPPVVAAAPLQEKVRIRSDDWQPYANSDKNVVATGFQEPQFGSATTDSPIQRETPWNPQRVEELPKRLSEPVRQRETRTGNRQELPPSASAPPEKTRGKLRENNPTFNVPRINLQPRGTQPSSSRDSRGEAGSAAGVDATTAWRISDQRNTDDYP
jgi:hypothetical protein